MIRLGGWGGVGEEEEEGEGEGRRGGGGGGEEKEEEEGEGRNGFIFLKNVKGEQKLNVWGGGGAI